MACLKLLRGLVTGRVAGLLGDAAVAVALMLSLTDVRPASAWLVGIDGMYGGDPGAYDEARALALDSRGYIFAGGSIDQPTESWLVVKLAPGDGHELWRTKLSGTWEPFPWGERLTDLAVDSDGDAIAVGHMKTDQEDFTVVKLRGSDGHELWRVLLDEPEPGSQEFATTVSTTANGDVIAAGSVGPGGTSSWLIVRLRGGDGAVLWTQRIAGSESGFAYAYDAAVDAAGDVVVVGATTNAGTAFDATAVKLAGSDGGIIWRTDVDGTGARGGPGYDYVERLALDAAGDVYAAGRISNSGWWRFGVIKLSGVTGSVLWRGDLCCGTDSGAALALAVTNDGGVIAGGTSERQELVTPFTVARFDAVTGMRDWRVVLPGPTGYGRANAVAVDKHGDVWAAGQIEVNAEGKTDAYVVKIHPCGVDEPCKEIEYSYDAEVVFERRRDGSSTSPEDDFDEYFAMLMGDQNAPVLAGVLYENHPEYGPDETHTDFAVERFSESGRDYSGPNPFIPACDDGADSDGDGLSDLDDPGCDDAGDLFEEAGAPIVRSIGGRRMLAKDRFGNAKARRLALESRDPSLFVPAPGGASDPRLHGAVLELVNSASGEHSYAALPAAGWVGVESRGGSTAYRYRDPKRVFGPCRLVELRPLRLKASCQGRAIAFSLDEPRQGSLAGRIHLAGGERICTEFGGSIRSDSSTVSGGEGLFYAEDAPAPLACAGSP